jgi:hypothetical protein
MASPLIIPGVQVRTQFEPAPVLPGATGILGVVGVADRGPVEPTPVGNFGEFQELFGPASTYTLPEVRTAFSNGVARAFIARIPAGSGRKAKLNLLDNDGEVVATLEARAEGEWGNRIGVRVTQVKTLGQLGAPGVKAVDLEVLYEGRVVETFQGLTMEPRSPDYFFARVNTGSRLVVAYDPLFEKSPPAPLAKTALQDGEARAARATLRAGAEDVVLMEAKRIGRGGNQSAVKVSEGRAGLVLFGAADAPSVEILAREPGPAGTSLRVSVSAASPDTVNMVVLPSARTLGPFASVDEIVAGLVNDPELIARAKGAVRPAVISATSLRRRVTLDVITEGKDTGRYEDLADLAAIAAISDPQVQLSALELATQLPDANEGVPLQGGRNKGPALALLGDGTTEPLLELAPAGPAAQNLSVRIERVADRATISVFLDDEIVETFPDLSMDPDDPNYLPVALEGSRLMRAYDLFVRSRTTSFPRVLARTAPLADGASPNPEAYQEALDRLESVEEVDLVIASVNHQLSPADVRSVHRAVNAHCTKMADVARNRIGLGSVTPSETASPADILDHANEVRSDHFILCAPANSEAAVAGLLGLQEYFQSPTFKTVPNLPVAPGRYTDAQLEQLLTGNVLVVNERRKVGVIVVKGLLTSGRQVNVQRTANKAVRDVKAIADKYVGLLNNQGVRNALRQQIFALLLQMERDGALVPSTDGQDPAFRVDVYSTQADFANGIVRVDIAVRPVRAIDYVYATILVKN